MAAGNQMIQNFHKGRCQTFLLTELRQQFSTVVEPFISEVFPPESQMAIAIVDFHHACQHQSLKLIGPTDFSQQVIGNFPTNVTSQCRSVCIKPDVGESLPRLFQSGMSEIIGQSLSKSPDEMSLSAASFSIDNDASTALIRSSGINGRTTLFEDAMMDPRDIAVIVCRLPWIADDGSTKWVRETSKIIAVICRGCCHD
jgi:hypothetical protein